MRPDHLRTAYREAELYAWQQDRQAWLPLTAPLSPHLIITSANPWSLALTDAMNAARDAVLTADLAARWPASQRHRVRAQAADHTWREDGWMVPWDQALAQQFIHRYQQAGAYRFSTAGRDILWDDGTFEVDHSPDLKRDLI